VNNVLEGVHYFESILDTVGHTPLVRLRKVARDLPCPVLAKMETFNPGGSVNPQLALDQA
jgi:cystathionine beta-synthase